MEGKVLHKVTYKMRRRELGSASYYKQATVNRISWWHTLSPQLSGLIAKCRVLLEAHIPYILDAPADSGMPHTSEMPRQALAAYHTDMDLPQGF